MRRARSYRNRGMICQVKPSLGLIWNCVVGRRWFCFPYRSPEHRTKGKGHPFWMMRVRWCRHGSDVHPKMVRRWMAEECENSSMSEPHHLRFGIYGLTAITRRVERDDDERPLRAGARRARASDVEKGGKRSSGTLGSFHNFACAIDLKNVRRVKAPHLGAQASPTRCTRGPGRCC